MSEMGADDQQLTQLGSTLKHQPDAINQIISTVTSALGNTVWKGPARTQFEQDWEHSFKGALGRLNEAFVAAGTDCIKRSEALVQAMAH